MLHVTQEATLLRLSVWENLTLGRETADPNRVIEILKALQMKKTLVLLEQEQPHLIVHLAPYKKGS